ncbi:hypothetical protein BH20ACT10_BH20ACT10_22010 [soil metagenome]
MLALSVSRSTSFHKGLAVAAFVAFGAAIFSGRFEVGAFVEGLPDYFGIVAVLLVLSLAGYPIRAARYESQIRSLMAALTRRGARPRATAGVMGHLLGAVLDVGSYVLVDVIFARAAPRERVAALKWAARGFSFVPLWTNINLLTATVITLTGASYFGFLGVSLPFVVVGVALLVFFAQREGGEVEGGTNDPLGRGAAAVVLYPVALITSVALVNLALPNIPLTTAIAITVVAAVSALAAVAAFSLRSRSPFSRLGSETRDSLVNSHMEFALFGSAGILVLSLDALGFLEPLGGMFRALPEYGVPLALAGVVALGFVVGIHVLPMVLLIHSTFPLDGGSSPALWAVAIIIGCQAALLATPFSNSVTMISRLSGEHPIKTGPKENWRFSLFVAVAGAAYLTFMTWLVV